MNCATDHVIENEDFGTEPVKSDEPKTKHGRCWKCARKARVKKCNRCAKFFCEGKNR